MHFSPSDMVEVMHGTTSARWAEIQQNGLRSGSCVTDSADIAWYYAEATLDEEQDQGSAGSSHDVVLTFSIDITYLDVDHQALAEPVWAGLGPEDGRLSDEEITKRLDELDELDGRQSLSLVRSAKTNIDIPAHLIQKM